jgi:hypothetical protein
MSASTPTGSSGDERTLGQLVAQASQDLSTIVRSEVALAKAEVTSGVKVMGKGAGLLGAAGFLGLLAVIVLLHAAAEGLVAAGLPAWAAYLIVAGVLLLIAAILALVGKNALTSASPAPQKAITHAQETIATLKSR